MVRFKILNMKKILSIFAIFFVLSCSSDDNISSLCNEQVVFFYEKNQLGPKRLIKSELGSVKLLLVMI